MKTQGAPGFGWLKLLSNSIEYYKQRSRWFKKKRSRGLHSTTDVILIAPKAALSGTGCGLSDSATLPHGVRSIRNMAINYTPLPILPVVESRLIGNVILVFLTVLVVALRFVARLVTGSKLGWDDFLTLACLPQGIGLLICQGLCESAKSETELRLAVSLTCNNDQFPHQEQDIPRMWPRLISPMSPL